MDAIYIAQHNFKHTGSKHCYILWGSFPHKNFLKRKETLEWLDWWCLFGFQAYFMFQIEPLYLSSNSVSRLWICFAIESSAPESWPCISSRENVRLCKDSGQEDGISKERVLKCSGDLMEIPCGYWQHFPMTLTRSLGGGFSPNSLFSLSCATAWARIFLSSRRPFRCRLPSLVLTMTSISFPSQF